MKKDDTIKDCTDNCHHYQLVCSPTIENGHHLLIFCSKCGKIIYKYITDKN